MHTRRFSITNKGKCTNRKEKSFFFFASHLASPRVSGPGCVMFLIKNGSNQVEHKRPAGHGDAIKGLYTLDLHSVKKYQ